MRLLTKMFLDHPEAVNESYFEHVVFAFTFSARRALMAKVMQPASAVAETALPHLQA